MADSLTQQVWDALPGYVREADAQLWYPLRTWLSGLCDQVQPTIDALAIEDLCDPQATPRVLLPYVAALVGVDLTGIPEADQRAFIASDVTHLRGTPAAIAARVGLTLTGTRYVAIESPYLADPMRIRVSTYTTETPDPAVTTAAAALEVPAWLELTTTTIAGITYTVLTSRYATYAVLTATGKTYATLAAET